MSITSSSAHLLQGRSQCLLPTSSTSPSSCSTSNNVSVVTISSSSLTQNQSRSSSPSSSSLSSPAALDGLSILKNSSSSNNSHSVKLKISGVNTESPSCSTSTINSPSIGGKGKKTIKAARVLPCKDREYDADKHCGVKTEGMDKECTRSLTCKTHSLSLRRSVTGRSKSFDDLLEEHRLAKEEAMRLAGKEVKPTKKKLKALELEAKKVTLSQEGKKDIVSRKRSIDKSVMSPSNSSNLSVPSPMTAKGTIKASSKRPTPAPSPCNSVTSNMVSIDSPLGSVVNETCSSSLSISKKTLQQDVTLKTKGKKKQKTLQMSGKDLPQPQEEQKPTVPKINVSNCSDERSLLQSNNNKLPLIIRAKPKELALVEGSDGIVYLKHPPRPLAVNTFNCRHLNLTPSQGNGSDLADDSFYVSSRLFTRSNDSTYTALKTVFQLNSQLDSSANKHAGSLGAGTIILTASNPSIPVTNLSKTTTSAASPKKVKKNLKEGKLNQKQVSVESGGSSPSPLQPSNGHNIVFNTLQTGTASVKRKQSTQSNGSSSVGLSAPSLTSLLESGAPSSSPSTFIAAQSPSFSSLVHMNSNSPSMVVNNAISPVSGATNIVINSSSPVGNKKMRSSSLNQNNGYGLSAPTLESLLDAGITPSSNSVNLLGSPSLGSSNHPLGSESNSVSSPSLSSAHSLLASTLESGFNPSLSSPNHLHNHLGMNQQQQSLHSSPNSGVKQQLQMNHHQSLPQRPEQSLSSPQKSRNAHNSPHLISLLDSGPTSTALNSSWTAKRTQNDHNNPNNTCNPSSSWEPSFDSQ